MAIHLNMGWKIRAKFKLLHGEIDPKILPDTTVKVVGIFDPAKISESEIEGVCSHLIQMTAYTRIESPTAYGSYSLNKLVAEEEDDDTEEAS